MSESQALSSVVTMEVPEEILRMQRKLVIQQLTAALRGSPTLGDVEEIVDGLILLAVANLWQRMRTKEQK